MSDRMKGEAAKSARAFCVSDWRKTSTAARSAGPAIVLPGGRA